MERQDGYRKTDLAITSKRGIVVIPTGDYMEYLLIAGNKLCCCLLLADIEKEWYANECEQNHKIWYAVGNTQATKVKEYDYGGRVWKDTACNKKRLSGYIWYFTLIIF